MAHFLLYQLLPIAALWTACRYLERYPAFARWSAPAIALAGMAVQLALWHGSVPDLAQPDSRGYHRLATGEETDLRSLLYRPRLYPWFLALFPSLEAATLAQCLLKGVMGAFVIGLVRRMGASPGTVAFAAALFSFNAYWLREPLQILDTTLFAFLLTGVLWLAAECAARFTPGRFLWLGAFAGLAALCRQVADPTLLLVFAGVLAPLCFGPSRPPRPAAIAGGIALALALAFAGAAANRIQHGLFLRSVALGVNVYTHSAYYELADPDSREWDFVLARLPDARESAGTWDPHWRSGIPWPVNDLPHRLERALGTATAEEILRADSLLAARYRAWVAEDPIRFAASAWNESVRLLWKSEEYYPSSVIGEWASPPAAAIRAERGIIHQPPALLLLFALPGILAIRRPRGVLLLPATGAAAYLVLFPLLQVGFTRYALPAYPVLSALAAIGWQSAWAMLRAAIGRATGRV
jgi:hypothetical protein